MKEDHLAKRFLNDGQETVKFRCRPSNIRLSLSVRCESELKSEPRPTKTTVSRLILSYFTLIASILGGCRCPWACTNTSLTESSHWSQSGIEAFHDGEHGQAEKLLSQAIQSRPSDPILREHLASIYVDQGKETDAISLLMQAAELSGPNADLFVKIGKLYLKNEKWIPANQYAKRALQADRKHPEAWILQADTKLSNGNLSEALNDYQRALSLQRDNPGVQLKIAEVHRLLGRPMRAFSTLEQLLRQTPLEQQSEPALVLAGRLLIELQQPAQAMEKLQLAANRKNASAECYIQMANAQVAMGHSMQAQETLANARRRYPNSQAIASYLQKLKPFDEQIAAVDQISGEMTR